MLWKPTYQPLYREMMRLNRDLDRLFTPAMTNGNTFAPAINVWMNEENVLVSAELPGFDADSIDIDIEDNVLTISGERTAPELAENETLLRRERLNGSFSRAINLPHRVAVDSVNATFTNGVLTIDLPRAAEDKPRKIAITTA